MVKLAETADFLETCKVLSETDLANAMDVLTPDHLDPRSTLAPVAERHFNPQATQAAWLEEVQENVAAYSALYIRLGDDVSRQTLSSIMNYRRTWNPDVLNVTQPLPKYFEWTFMPKKPDAVYVDGGAFDGGSILNFFKHYGTDYRQVYAYEPFAKSFADLHARLGERADVKLFQKGLWDSETNLGIVGSGQSANVVPITAENQDSIKDTIETATLDDTMEELPTFIKMDMEGAESKALRGGEQVIKSGLPALAICAYHLIDDLRVLPTTLEEFNPNYEFFLRNYKTTGSAEIVLYAR